MTSPGQFNGVAPASQQVWDMRAVGNFIGGGSGTGLLCVAAFAARGGHPQPELLIAGMALVALGLVSVFFEIGRPWRAANVVLGLKYSWMTREALFVVPVFAAGLVALWVPQITLLVCIPAAIYLYCQARILNAAKGIPAWREPVLLPLILATGIAEGTGLLVLASPILPYAPDWAGAAMMVAVVVRLLVWMVYRRRMAAGAAPAEAARVLVAFSMPFQLAGGIIPVGFVLVAALMPDLAAPATAAAGLAAAAAGWWLKATIVTKAAFNQGYAIPHAPARGDGRPGQGAAPGWD
jgi:phenylacetyl-CoA:acceptor oxidoreductase subunit 2